MNSLFVKILSQDSHPEGNELSNSVLMFMPVMSVLLIASYEIAIAVSVTLCEIMDK